MDKEVKKVFPVAPKVIFKSAQKRSSYLVRAKLYPLQRTVEITNPRKSNIVFDCLYKHPNMDVLDFKKILAKVLKLYPKNENRSFFLVTLI